MGKCYYYGKETKETQAFETRYNSDSAEVHKDDEIKRIIIDDDTELVIEKDTIYEIDRKCMKCLKNR